MKFASVLSILIVININANIRAQTGNIPDGPLLARAPQFCQWITTLGVAKGKKEESQKSIELRCVTTRTKNVFLQEFNDAFGRKWSTWVSGYLVATYPPDKGPVMIGYFPDPRLAVDYSKFDFPGLDWLSLKTFVKIASYKGRKCLLFSQTADIGAAKVEVARTVDAITGKEAMPGEKSIPLDRAKVINKMIEVIPARTESRSAVIDFDTRLPLYAVVGDTSYTFEFQSPPQIALELPPDIAKISSHENRSADSQAKVGRAY